MHTRRKDKIKDCTNRKTPVCVDRGRGLHLVQAPGTHHPCNGH